MAQLNRKLPMPLYYQLKEQLVEKVECGDFPLGEPIPPEMELVKAFKVSRATVRRAMSEMEHDGYIYRVPGKGTFVIRNTVKRGLSRLSSFSEDMRERGRQVTAQIVEFERVPAPAHIAEMLLIEPGKELIYINRLRFADKSPIALNISYLNLPDSISITREELEQSGSLWALLEGKGISLASADKTIEATLANEERARLLKIAVGAPLLAVEGVLFTAHQLPVEYHQVISCGDRYKYSIHLER